MSMTISWDKYDNLEIQDVHHKWHKRVIDYMIQYEYKDNIIFEILHFHESEDNEKMYRRYLEHILANECSIVALDENNEIQAVALGAWMTKEWKSWNALQAIYSNCKLSQFHNYLRLLMLNFHMENPLHTFDSFYLFEFQMKPELKYDDHFTEKFFHAICEVGRHMKMPRITYMATSIEQHDHMQAAGFHILCESIYSLYLEDNRRPFARLREFDEKQCSYFEKLVPPLIHYKEMVGFEQQDAQIEMALLLEMQTEQELAEARASKMSKA